MSETIGFFFVALSAVFFVIDPLGLVPIFVAMTASDDSEKRRRMARRATLVAFVLLSIFAIFGGLIFKAFGVTLDAFKVAGGILLLMTAVDMLRAQPSRTRSSPEETTEGSEKEDVAIVPLAMPRLAGPGAIATVMMLSGRGAGWLHTALVIVAVGFTCGVAYLLLGAANRFNQIFGHSGIAVLERIMGLLLAAIAVQFISDGSLAMIAASRAG